MNALMLADLLRNNRPNPVETWDINNSQGWSRFCGIRVWC